MLLHACCFRRLETICEGVPRQLPSKQTIQVHSMARALVLHGRCGYLVARLHAVCIRQVHGVSMLSLAIWLPPSRS